jgi:hypothetical protein
MAGGLPSKCPCPWVRQSDRQHVNQSYSPKSSPYIWCQPRPSHPPPPGHQLREAKDSLISLYIPNPQGLAFRRWRVNVWVTADFGLGRDQVLQQGSLHPPWDISHFLEFSLWQKGPAMDGKLESFQMWPDSSRPLPQCLLRSQVTWIGRTLHAEVLSVDRSLQAEGDVHHACFHGRHKGRLRWS